MYIYVRDRLTKHELLVLGTLAHAVEVSDAGDLGLVALAGHRRENANVFAYTTRPHVIVVRSLVCMYVCMYVCMIHSWIQSYDCQ